MKSRIGNAKIYVEVVFSLHHTQTFKYNPPSGEFWVLNLELLSRLFAGYYFLFVGDRRLKCITSLVTKQKSVGTNFAFPFSSFTKLVLCIQFILLAELNQRTLKNIFIVHCNIQKEMQLKWLKTSKDCISYRFVASSAF